MIDAIREWFRRVTKSYQKRSIQYMISISFTIVAMVGMIFLGLTLYLRFATSTEQMVKEDNRRVIEQVNMNLDTYLRNMMRVSDAMYYRVPAFNPEKDGPAQRAGLVRARDGQD